MRKILKWSGVAAAGVAAAMILTGVYLALTLPIREFNQQGAASALVFVANDGAPYASRGGFRGDALSAADLPPHLVEAVLAVEDRRFYEHTGFDLRGIARAAVANFSAGGIRQGGSTVTQQLAKVLFLNRERTFTRKIQEVMIAVWLEQRMSKERILALYLDRAYFGAGAYGIDGAAQRYFAKSARSVTLPEAAILAGLLQAPSRYAPTSDRDAALARATVVLDTMVEAGWLTPKRAEQARAELPAVRIQRGAIPGAGYFTDWVEASARAQMGARDGDFRVETTLDPRLQAIATNAVRSAMGKDGEKSDVGQAAAVVMGLDGAVLAMVGGVSYEDSQFNRAVQAKRQPGSTFKLFVYLTALQEGYTPNTLIYDGPIRFNGWTPDNFDHRYHGEVTLREAFTKSHNAASVALAQDIGRDKVIATAKRLGVRGDLQPVPSAALGTAEVNLIDMTAAYAAVADGVWRIEPYGFRSIRSGSGQDVVRRVSPADPGMILPWKWEEMVDLLESVVREGTGRAAALPGVQVAGKTGTSQDYRDAWFIGFTRDYVVGVWVGNDDNTPMKNVSGSGLPTRIARDIFSEAHGLKPRAPVRTSGTGSGAVQPAAARN